MAGYQGKKYYEGNNISNLAARMVNHASQL